MVKLVGAILILSSLLSLIFGIFINSEHNSKIQITGNAVSNILTQPKIELNFIDYAGGVIFSYSIISFIMGIIFLFRV